MLENYNGIMLCQRPQESINLDYHKYSPSLHPGPSSRASPTRSPSAITPSVPCNSTSPSSVLLSLYPAQPSNPSSASTATGSPTSKRLLRTASPACPSPKSPSPRSLTPPLLTSPGTLRPLPATPSPHTSLTPQTPTSESPARRSRLSPLRTKSCCPTTT